MRRQCDECVGTGGVTAGIAIPCICDVCEGKGYLEDEE